MSMEYEIKYTIGFCISEPASKILMLWRSNRPNANKWNGLGGKIDYASNESHRQCVIRELDEESEGLIKLDQADKLDYAGIVTWDVTRGDERYFGGMHAYIARFGSEDILFGRRETREGVLDWLSVSDVIDSSNSAIVENIPHFLPLMLEGKTARYHCTYMADELTNFEVLPIECYNAPWPRR